MGSGNRTIQALTPRVCFQCLWLFSLKVFSVASVKEEDAFLCNCLMWASRHFFRAFEDITIHLAKLSFEGKCPTSSIFLPWDASWWCTWSSCCQDRVWISSLIRSKAGPVWLESKRVALMSWNLKFLFLTHEKEFLLFSKILQAVFPQSCFPAIWNCSECCGAIPVTLDSSASSSVSVPSWGLLFPMN